MDGDCDVIKIYKQEVDLRITADASEHSGEWQPDALIKDFWQRILANLCIYKKVFGPGKTLQDQLHDHSIEPSGPNDFGALIELLRKQNLTGFKLSGLNLRGARLREPNLSGADWMRRSWTGRVEMMWGNYENGHDLHRGQDLTFVGQISMGQICTGQIGLWKSCFSAAPLRDY